MVSTTIIGTFADGSVADVLQMQRLLFSIQPSGNKYRYPTAFEVGGSLGEVREPSEPFQHHMSHANPDPLLAVLDRPTVYVLKR